MTKFKPKEALRMLRGLCDDLDAKPLCWKEKLRVKLIIIETIREFEGDRTSGGIKVLKALNLAHIKLEESLEVNGGEIRDALLEVVALIAVHFESPLSLYFDADRISPRRVAEAIGLISGLLGHELQIVGANTLPPDESRFRKVS